MRARLYIEHLGWRTGYISIYKRTGVSFKTLFYGCHNYYYHGMDGNHSVTVT
jgi:hypothetical protein